MSKYVQKLVNLPSTRVKKNRKSYNVRVFTPLLVISKQYKVIFTFCSQKYISLLFHFKHSSFLRHLQSFTISLLSTFTFVTCLSLQVIYLSFVPALFVQFLTLILRLLLECSLLLKLIFKTISTCPWINLIVLQVIKFKNLEDHRLFTDFQGKQVDNSVSHEMHAH